MAGRQLVVFNVNNESFGVEITQVNTIERPMDIFKIPNTPDYIEGLINLRGKVYTVFNLRKKFGYPAAELDENTKIIIVNLNSIMAGFIVDEVNEILTFEDADIENTPPTIAAMNRKYISGIAKKGEKIIMILDLSYILSVSEEEEAGKIAKVASK